LILSSSQIAYSQSRVLVIEGDTVVLQTPEEHAFWVKQYYRVKELEKNASVDSLAYMKLDSNYVDCQLNLEDKNDQLVNTEKIVEFKDEEISTLNDLLTENKKAVRRQKFYKWTAIVIGTASTTLMTYLYLTK
jgi:hypothetical protein